MENKYPETYKFKGLAFKTLNGPSTHSPTTTTPIYLKSLHDMTLDSSLKDSLPKGHPSYMTSLMPPILKKEKNGAV